VQTYQPKHQHAIEPPPVDLPITPSPSSTSLVLLNPGPFVAHGAAATPPRQPFNSSNNNPHINLSPDLFMISSYIAHSELTNLIKYQTFLPPITQPAHPGKYQTIKIAWHPNAPNGNKYETRRKHGLIS